MPSDRRFPPPWRFERTSGGYVVKDANDYPVVYLYAHDLDRYGFVDYGKLTWDQARRIAAGIARLPELLGKVSKPLPMPTDLRNDDPTW